MALKIEGKECTPSLFSQSVVGQFTPKAWQTCTQQTEKPFPLHTNCSFMASLCACPASSVSIERILSTYDLVCWSKIRKSLDAEKAEKLVKIYRLCRAEKLASRIY